MRAEFRVRVNVGHRYKEVFKSAVTDTLMRRSLFHLRYLNGIYVADGTHQTPTVTIDMFLIPWSQGLYPCTEEIDVKYLYLGD